MRRNILWRYATRMLLSDPIRGLKSTATIRCRSATERFTPLTAAGLQALREEYTRTIDPARALAAEALKLERELSDLVNQAYGLTPEEIALMWATAPPRMPIPKP